MPVPQHFEQSDWLRFVLLPAFDRKWSELGLDDADLMDLQIAIMRGPKGQAIAGDRWAAKDQVRTTCLASR